MRFFSKGHSSRVSSDTNFALTEAGKKKADEFSTSGPRFEVLATLREQGPCTMRELADETPYSTGQIKHILNALRRQGYIKSMGTDE